MGNTLGAASVVLITGQCTHPTDHECIAGDSAKQDSNELPMYNGR
jgi:hypothetical protein